MSFPDRRTANVLFTVLFFAAVVGILYTARRILLIFIFAILFAYLIDPIVRFLQRHSLFFKNLRGPHVLEAYLVLLLLLGFAAHAFAPGLIGPNSKLFRAVPAMMDDLSTGEIATKIGEKNGWSESQELRLKEYLVRHRDQIQGLVHSAEKFSSSAVVVLVLVPILAIFFLADGARMADDCIQLISTENNHQAVREVAEELNSMLKKYIRAKVILGCMSFAFYSVSLLLMRFPHAIALGVLGGILEFIPVAGWMISAAAIICVGLLTHSHWIWMALILGLWRMVMDYFISPRVVGQNLEMHPLVVLFAVMVGGEIGGIVGIYLSIPFMVVVSVLWQKFVPSTARSAPELSPADKLS